MVVTASPAPAGRIELEIDGMTCASCATLGRVVVRVGLLNPIGAAASMAFASVFVVTNSLRLRRFHSLREGT